MACSRSLPRRRVRQAGALLWAGDGVANGEVARRCGAAAKSVRGWRSRFEAEGVASVGVVGAGRGRPPVIGADKVEAVVSDALAAVPDDGSAAWSTRAMGERHGVGKDTVARIRRARGLRPRRADAYKLSTGPDFESRAVDVVGLCLNPPEAAAVFAFDDKTRVQALDRAQPPLPMVPGRAAATTHDCKRHGTLGLFAAMNAAAGEALHDTRRRHTGRDVLGLFKLVDLHVPEDLEVHVVLDNLSAHKSQPARDWPAHPRRQRRRLHFTPTSSSWPNLIETWSSVPARKAPTDTSFTSAAELENRIDWRAEHCNDNPEPLTWTRTAQQTTDKAAPGQATPDRTTKSATHH